MEPSRAAAAPPGSKTVAAGPTLTKLQTVSAANQATKHIGAEGSEFVANILRSVNPPQEALKRVQETCGLSNPLSKPLLTMLDYLEVKRRDAHLHILNRYSSRYIEYDLQPCCFSSVEHLSRRACTGGTAQLLQWQVPAQAHQRSHCSSTGAASTAGMRRQCACHASRCATNSAVVSNAVSLHCSLTPLFVATAGRATCCWTG